MFPSFFKHNKKHLKAPEQTGLKKICVVITGADENAALPFQKAVQNALLNFGLFETQTQSEQTFENFLDLSNKNFFDFLDSGLKILRKEQADILIRLYQQGNFVRVNFQTPDMYMADRLPFLSLLSCLYLPISYFQEMSLPSEISALIASTLLSLNLRKDERYTPLLQNLVDLLSKNKSPQGIEAQYMAHILNFLAFNYMSANMSHFEKENIKLAVNLLRVAYQKQNKNDDSFIEGALLTTLGEIYQCALDSKNADHYSLLEHAIESYKKAQKHFNRYVFPYDYGHLSIMLAKLYFRFFKLSDDSQTLRDAVFHLREAEKIFTQTRFPTLWAEIKHSLGIYLSLLSARSNNAEIAELAIQSFRDEEQIRTPSQAPEKWAEIEFEIAQTYYHLGRRILKIETIEKAVEHYGNAFDMYAKLQKNEKLKQIERLVQKADEEIMRLEK
ncbi:MAG: hypothetical protein IJ870_02215 [Alphaproteobacteria bacterium]|nr:hypothetical protein [Alphaproteobacteria bacterium]